jgi:RimJ/RimL family protein N-acetyltransferase
MTYNISERYDMQAMCQFMARPEIYWATHDRLFPQPEQVDFTQELYHPQTATFAATFRGQIIGYVQFMRRTSIGAEMHLAFREGFRGKIAKAMTLFALSQIFQRGMLKVWAGVPSDNRLALLAARHIGMKQEGTLTRAIVTNEGLRDLHIFAISKDALFGHKSGNGVAS